MTSRENSGMTKKEDATASAKPATWTTRGNPDDVRSKASDLLEKDNEKELGEQNLDDKLDKTGGG